MQKGPFCQSVTQTFFFLYYSLSHNLDFYLGMATSIDFNTRELGHSSDRVLSYLDDFLPTLHIWLLISVY